MALFIFKGSKKRLKGVKTFFRRDFESCGIHETLKNIREMKDEIKCNNTPYNILYLVDATPFETYAERSFCIF